MSTKQLKGLGRGLDTLIPQDFDKALLTEENERVQKLFISDLKPNPQQPRRHFDETALNELASSIKRFGLLQPIVVTPAHDGSYTIIAGERRWRAAGMAGLKNIAAIVRSSEELEQLEIALVENVQRVDLSPLEQAQSIERLHQQFNLDYIEIAKKLDKAPSTVQNIARLLQLSEPAQQALREGRITEGHARAILALKDSAAQEELLRQVEAGGWSVRQAERYVSAHKQGARIKHKALERATQITTSETEKLASQLKTSVSLRRMAKGGRLEITFKNETDLKQILKKLMS